MRLIARFENAEAFITLAQVEAMTFLVDIVREVTAAMDQAHRAKEDDKHWLSVKLDRQLLELAAASLKVIVSHTCIQLFSITLMLPSS